MDDINKLLDIAKNQIEMLNNMRDNALKKAEQEMANIKCEKEKEKAQKIITLAKNKETDISDFVQLINSL